MFTIADAGYLELWLQTIGTMCCPRQTWAAKNGLARSEAEKFIKRMVLGTVSFFCEQLDYPDESEIDRYEPAGHGATADDRREDLAAFKRRTASTDAELVFDGGLCFIHSQEEHSIVFSSNVDLRRIEEICRILQANVVMFAHREEHCIALHVIHFSREAFLKALDDAHHAFEREMIGAMQKLHRFQEQFEPKFQ